MSASLAADHGATPSDTPPSASFAVGRALEAVVVKVDGQLDDASGVLLERVLRDLVDGQGNRSVVVDLSDARIGDPQALTALFLLAEQARRRGARFLVREPPGAPPLGGTTSVRTARRSN